MPPKTAAQTIGAIDAEDSALNPIAPGAKTFGCEINHCAKRWAIATASAYDSASVRPQI